MRNLAIFGRSRLPIAPFEVSRNIRPSGQAVEYAGDSPGSYPPAQTLSGAARQAFRVAWNGALQKHQQLRGKVHPQTNAMALSILHRHEIASDQRGSAYRQLARKFLELSEEAPGGQPLLIGALSLKKVTTHKINEDRIMMLQPGVIDDEGINTLRKQRWQSRRGLGELASLTALEEVSEVEMPGMAAPLDVGIILARFPGTVAPDLCDQLAEQVQGRIDTLVAGPLQLEFMPFKVGETALVH
jgi:hypothetical protein